MTDEEKKAAEAAETEPDPEEEDPNRLIVHGKRERPPVNYASVGQILVTGR